MKERIGVIGRGRIGRAVAEGLAGPDVHGSCPGDGDTGFQGAALPVGTTQP